MKTSAHYTTTRKSARLTAKHLKAKGYSATSSGKKTTNGWLVSVVEKSHKKHVATALNGNGSTVPVFYK